jgi:ribonuclease P/MRP protein subunit POP5
MKPMKNIKTIPILRDKKRYFAFEVIAEKTLNRYEMIDCIMNSIFTLFGDAGGSIINARLISFDGTTGIVRCQRDKTGELRSALACINNSRGARVSIFVLGISGTIKGATEKFIQKTHIEVEEPEKELINRKVQFHAISGKIINSYKNEIDILPDNPISEKIADNANTKFIGLTVFDIKEMI